ncbi:MAG: hypothetical protein Q8L99_06185 [Polycyclovorans sp.]|nr:hypothetical protein [Polycyclovorans sp.]
MSAVIPATYREWRHCIEVECGIGLTPAYLAERLTALRRSDSQEVRRFAPLYGADHWQRVVSWFEQAAMELSDVH